jgi:hypothetical protein
MYLQVVTKLPLTTSIKTVIMRDKIQKIVVQAVAGTKDLTESIDQLLVLYNVSIEFRSKIGKQIVELEQNKAKRIEELTVSKGNAYYDLELNVIDAKLGVLKDLN